MLTPQKIWNFQRISWVLIHPQPWLVIAADGGMCCRLSGSCSGGCRFSGRWGGLDRTRTWSLHGQWDKARSPPSHPRCVPVMCWFRGSKCSEETLKPLNYGRGRCLGNCSRSPALASLRAGGCVRWNTRGLLCQCLGECSGVEQTPLLRVIRRTCSSTSDC